MALDVDRWVSAAPFILPRLSLLFYVLDFRQASTNHQTPQLLSLWRFQTGM